MSSWMALRCGASDSTGLHQAACLQAQCLGMMLCLQPGHALQSVTAAGGACLGILSTWRASGRCNVLLHGCLCQPHRVVSFHMNQPLKLPSLWCFSAACIHAHGPCTCTLHDCNALLNLLGSLLLLSVLRMSTHCQCVERATATIPCPGPTATHVLSAASLLLACRPAYCAF